MYSQWQPQEASTAFFVPKFSCVTAFLLAVLLPPHLAARRVGH